MWSGHLVGSPTIPSLADEGKAAGGYDVRLEGGGFIYFAQFKIARYLTRRSAIEARDFGWPVPYYRFGIYGAERSRQHQSLLDHETAGGIVEYVAPRFHTQADLNRLYSTRQVHQAAQRITPRSIGALPDREDHAVVYTEDGHRTALHSQFKEFVGKNAGEIVEGGFGSRLVESPDDASAPGNDQSSSTPLRQQILRHSELLRRSAPNLDLGASADGPVEELRLLSRLVIGAETFVVSTARRVPAVTLGQPT